MSYGDHARHVAGHYALRIAYTAGVDIAEQYFAGVLAAFALALCALVGRSRTEQIFLTALSQCAPNRSVPKLITNNGERVA